MIGNLPIAEMEKRLAGAGGADWLALLADWNEKARLIDARRTAFAAGDSPYLVTDIVTGLLELEGHESALDACNDLQAALETISFREMGDDFHRGKAREIIEGLRSVISYERGDGGEPAAVADPLHDAVRGLIWTRLWQLARIHDVAAIARMARLYPHAYRGDAQQTLFAVEYFLAAYGQWNLVEEALAGIANPDAMPPDLAMQVARWKAEAAVHRGEPQAALAIADELAGPAGAASPVAARLAATHALNAVYRNVRNLTPSDLGDLADRAQRLLEAADAADPASAPALLILLLAELLEDRGDKAGASALYRRAASHDPGGYLPTEFWRAISFLCSEGEWPLAASIHDRGVLGLWPLYEALATIPPAERYAGRGSVLPDRAVMLNCDGIGDDLWRILMLLRLKGPAAQYAIVVDDRLVTLLERSIPQFAYLTRSRCQGSHAVSATRFHADRIGVHASVDIMRVTRDIQSRIAEYGELCLSEDVFSEYYRAGGTYRFPLPQPVLRADTARRQAAEAWLSSLPPGRRAVGLSWRSGLTGELVRERNHFHIDELGSLLTLEGINWVVLQYQLTQSELDLARSRFGIDLHVMPGLDLRNDIEGIVALGSALDHAITTPSTIEPLIAATGLPVTSLSTGYDSVNQYRLEPDGETDRVMPNLSLLTLRRFGTKEGIVQAARARLARNVSAVSRRE